MTGILDPVSDPLQSLGEKVKAERIRQRYGVKNAALAAGIARDTWKRIEDGKGVHDTSRQAALALLGLDWWGEPVGGGDQDRDYVASPGATEVPGVTDAEVLQELRDMQRRLEELSERLANHARERAEPVGGTGGEATPETGPPSDS